MSIKKYNPLQLKFYKCFLIDIPRQAVRHTKIKVPLSFTLQLVQQARAATRK